MPELTTRPAALREVLLAVRARVAAVTGLATERVIVTAADPHDVPHLAAERDALLYLGKETPSEAFEGGGRYVNLHRRELEIVCRVRLSLDETGSDLQRLTEETFGLTALEDALADALDGWIPADDDGNHLSLPLAPGGFSQPRPDRDDPNWVSSRMQTSFEYLRVATLPEA